MICVECKGRTCITCDTIWHPSETCAEIAARRAEARDAKEGAATTKYLTKNVKICPQCNVRGEKDSGCNHMTCKIQYYHCSLCQSLRVPLPLGPRCKHQYCWICLADYREIHLRGNTAHQEDCRYHSNNLPPNVQAAIADPILHRYAAAEQAAEQAARARQAARQAARNMMDMEEDRATEDDAAATDQATEDTIHGIEQNSQARPTESPRPSLRNRRTSRFVNTRGLVGGSVGTRFSRTSRCARR